jgi:MFS family permease
MLICFTAMVGAFSGTSNRAGNAMGVVFLYLFVTFYASCFDATSYVYCSEIFPTRLRAQGVSASIFGLFSMTLLYTEAAATAFANIGWRYYLVFVVVPLCGLPFLARLPETKGLSLEEIAAVFGDEVALDLTHMSTAEKTVLENEIRDTANHDAGVLDEIMQHEQKIRSISAAGGGGGAGAGGEKKDLGFGGVREVENV